MKRKARTVRCYTDQELQENIDIALDKRSSHHVSTVLRGRPGQALQLFNGNGKEYNATIVESGKKTLVSIHDANRCSTESPIPITLIQSVARSDRMDMVLQKASELGAHSIVPVYSRHSIAKLDEHREQKKHQHWQSILISACEQCGRSVIPVLHNVTTLKNYCETLTAPTDNEHRWVLSPTASHSLNPESQVQAVQLMVGPESGLDDDEVALANQAGFTALQLGPRILRTETAGLAAISVVQTLFGDYL
jgi:16S rRNA (uracil1498-N3)-methyltransferase